MNKKSNKKIVTVIIFLFFVIFALSIFIVCIPYKVDHLQSDLQEEVPQPVLSKEKTVDAKKSDGQICKIKTVFAKAIENKVSVKKIGFTRVSNQKIKVYWWDIKNSQVDYYVVKKRQVSQGQKNMEWKVVGKAEPDRQAYGKKLSLIDNLENSMPQQYEYRVDIKVLDESQCMPVKSRSIIASNIIVCIDPGHYKGRNQIFGQKSYGYIEGNFTLEIAFALKKFLKDKYGISSYMTRNSGDITLGGYTNFDLDNGHISLRGEYASKKDSDLFVSLHTNANREYANGYETSLQPVAINKPIVIINVVACGSDWVINLCNSIGINLSKVNKQLGLSTVDGFKTVTKNNIEEWSDSFNDSLDTVGTVVCRNGEHGDYYGVLRGASNVGVPGIIIEHGFHTVSKVRKSAMKGKLAAYWAEADAMGIADGFNFSTLSDDSTER